MTKKAIFLASILFACASLLSAQGERRVNLKVNYRSTASDDIRALGVDSIVVTAFPEITFISADKADPALPSLILDIECVAVSQVEYFETTYDLFFAYTRGNASIIGPGGEILYGSEVRQDKARWKPGVGSDPRKAELAAIEVFKSTLADFALREKEQILEALRGAGGPASR